MAMDPITRTDIGIGPSPVRPAGYSPASRQVTGPTFKDRLQEAQANRGVKFSAHAQSRIESRQIPIDSSSMDRIEGAVNRAATKGARESLVLLDQTAFIVSVPNRTVITVVDPESIRQNVFTNIDSAVIA